jgi:hypothetical protein
VIRPFERLAFSAGLVLVAVGIWQLLPQRSADVWENVSYNQTATSAGSTEAPAPNYLGWGTLLLGFLTLGSSNYFKWREDKRADRAETREIERTRRKKS